jgi:SAM-dependent methyltransferase
VSNRKAVKEDIPFDGNNYGFDRSYADLKDSTAWQDRLDDILKEGCGFGRLLDIGCNYGFFLRTCETYFDAHGLDISRYAICRAKLHAPTANVMLGDVRMGLPYKDGTFDVVTMFDTLEHLANHGCVLRDVCRILKPGGLLTLTTPNRWSINSILFGRDYWFKRDATHVVLFSRGSLKRALSEAGFGHVRLRTISLLHFLSDFGRRYTAPGASPDGDTTQTPPRRGWVSRIPAPLRPPLRRLYRWIHDFPTPWGANLYAVCRKQ